MPLRIPIDVGRNESALSVALRAARANHVGSLVKMEKALDQSLRKIAFDTDAISKLNQLVSVPYEVSIQPIRPCKSPEPPQNILRDRVTYLGAELSKLHFRDGNPAFCPSCLGENDQHLFIFQFSLCGVCPKHGTRLRTACLCGKAIDERMLFTQFCACMRNLRLVESEVTYGNAQKFWQEIEARLLKWERHEGEDLTSLAHLSTDDLLSLFAVFLSREYVGVYAPSLEHFLQGAGDLDHEKLAKKSDAAIARMLKWRDQLPTLIEELRPQGSGKTPLLESFSSNFRSLMHWCLPPGLRQYQDEVVEQLEARRSRENSRSHIAGDGVVAPVISAEDTAALLGVKADRAFSIFRRPGEVVTGRQRRWLNAKDVDAFLEGLKRVVSPFPLSDAADYVTVAEAQRAAGALSVDLTTLMWAVADGSIPAWFSWEGRPRLTTIVLDRRGFMRWCGKRVEVCGRTVALGHARQISGFDEDILQRLDAREREMSGHGLRSSPNDYALEPLLDTCAKYARLARTAHILNLPRFKVEARFKLESVGTLALVGAKGELQLAEEYECRRILFSGKPWN